MQTPRAEWTHWADLLRRLRLDGIAAWLLEAAGPLALLGAQALYFCQPFFGGKQIQSLAHMLEEDNEVQAFSQYLRGEAGP